MRSPLAELIINMRTDTNLFNGIEMRAAEFEISARRKR